MCVLSPVNYLLDSNSDVYTKTLLDVGVTSSYGDKYTYILSSINSPKVI